MSFDRKSLEQITNDMITWVQGTSKKLTDFRVGSRVRAILEASAREVEQLYDKVYRSMKEFIESNLYTVFGFTKNPAIYATGTVTFGRTVAGTQDYLIPAGTMVQTAPTDQNDTVQFQTIEDVTLLAGATSIDTSVVCVTAGIIGNVNTGLIIDFQIKPSGIDTVTNALAFTNGLEEETSDQLKVRFQKFISSLKRGTPQAIEYGATTAQLTDSSGNVTEYVVTSKAFEDLVNKLGQIDLYVWNGSTGASQALLDQVSTTIYGYYDAMTGTPVYGYKSAGIKVNVYPATGKSVTIKLTITPDSTTTLSALQPYIQNAIDAYFGSFQLGQTLVYLELLTRIKNIAGIADLALSLSTDGGTTYVSTNITAQSTEVIIQNKPTIYG